MESTSEIIINTARDCSAFDARLAIPSLAYRRGLDAEQTAAGYELIDFLARHDVRAGYVHDEPSAAELRALCAIVDRVGSA